MNIPVLDALTGDLRYILTFRYKRIEEMRSVYLPRTYPSLEDDFYPVFRARLYKGEASTIGCNCDENEFEIYFEIVYWRRSKSRVVLADPELLSALETLTHKGLPSHFEPHIQRLP